jgi:hypothetical protein
MLKLSLPQANVQEYSTFCSQMALITEQMMYYKVIDYYF